MYAKPIIAAAVPTVAAAATLPNTGGNWVISAAIAVGVGMLTWGALYARSGR